MIAGMMELFMCFFVVIVFIGMWGYLGVVVVFFLVWIGFVVVLFYFYMCLMK